MQNSQHDIVVVGASSGGLEALLEIAAGLPADLPAALFIVVHVSARSTSRLPEILSRAGALPAAHGRDGEVIQPGRIYIAPPDCHLLVHDGSIRVVRGPKENNHRPAIDPLFRSAAHSYGSRAIGVVLSGSMDDGAAGLFAIKSRGGIAVVQDPNDALFPDMPRAALAAVSADFCVAKKQVAKLIIELTRKPVAGEHDQGGPMKGQDEMAEETALAAIRTETIGDNERPGTPAVYGCPDCGGTLWELQDDQWLRFRCRVGHAYSAEGLLESQSESWESALWAAFRGLQESASLARRLAERARDNKYDLAAEKFAARSQRAEQQAKLIREMLMSAQKSAEAE